MIRWARGSVLLLGLMAGVGCGSNRPDPVAVKPKISTAKEILLKIAESGELDSGLSELQDKFEEIKQTDASKGTELLQDLAKLKSLRDDSTAIQEWAKKMSEKL